MGGIGKVDCKASPDEGTLAVCKPRAEVFGVHFDQLNESAVVDHVFLELEQGRGGWMVTPNLHILREVSRDPEVARLVRAAPLVVMDGAPVEWAGRLARRTTVARTPGSTVFWSLNATATSRGVNVLLVGGRSGSAELAAEKLEAIYPGIGVTTHFPPFGFESDPAARMDIRKAVRACEGGLVFIGLGCPKQERLMAELSAEFPSTWFFGVGAAIDFASGQVQRAPMWMQKAGLEWAHRMMTEPHRLARRYLVDDLPFAFVLTRWALAERYSKVIGSGSQLSSAGPLPELEPVLGHEAQAFAEALAAAPASGPAAKAALRVVIASATATPTTRAHALDSLVDLLRQEGKYAECADLLRERLMLPFEATAPRIHAQTQLARFLMESGNLFEAVASATRSVAEAERSGAAGTLEGVKLRAIQAELLRLRGDLIGAELHVGLALVAADRLGDPVGRGSAAWSACLISADQGRSDDALGWAQVAGELLRGAGEGLSAALVRVVEVMIELDSVAGAGDASFEQLEAALAIIREQGTVSQQGGAFIQMARLHLRRGDTENAHVHIQMALAQLGDANVIDTATALSVKAQILAMAGDHVAAHEVATTAASTLAGVGAQRLAESVWADLADIPRMADFMPRADDSPTRGVVVPGPRKAASARRAFVVTGAPL